MTTFARNGQVVILCSDYFVVSCCEWIIAQTKDFLSLSLSLTLFFFI